VEQSVDPATHSAAAAAASQNTAAELNGVTGDGTSGNSAFWQANKLLLIQHTHTYQPLPQPFFEVDMGELVTVLILGE